MRLADFRADLHIHTCLSPCADDTMTPTAIVTQAQAQGLDLIGICDHNCALNVTAVRRAGVRYGVSVLGGMEITTREEIHILGFFADDVAMLDMQELVQAHLPGTNDPDAFGFQIVMDERDQPIGLDEHLLIGATDLALEAVVAALHERGALAIASHINRDAFSIISQLGFMPPDLPLDGMELAPAGEDPDTLLRPLPGLPFLTSSDAHVPGDVGRTHTTLRVQAASFDEFAKALRGVGGRFVVG